MASGIVVDELITKLEYQHDAATVREAERAVKTLEATNKAAAAATDKLAAENRKLAEHTDTLAAAQLDLSEQLAESAAKTDKLRDEQRELRAATKAAGGATDEQRQRLAELDRELAAAQRHTRDLREESARLGREKQKVGAESRKLAREQRDVAETSRRAAGDQRRLADAMRKADASAKSEAFSLAGLADKISGVAGGQIAADAIRAITGAVVELGKEIITTGANFESLRARLKTVEGSTEAAGDAFRMIQDFAKSTPFEVENLTEAFTALRVRGVQPTTQMLTGLGDMTSSFGADFKTMTDAIASAARGEFEPIRQFGVMMKKVGDQLQVTFKGQTTTIAMNNAAVAELMASYGQMSGIQGAMAGQMATTAGMFSNLKDTISAAFDAIAQMGVLDEVKLLMQALMQSMGDEGLAKVIADVLVTALRTVRELFESLPQETLIDFVQSLVTVLGQLIGVLVNTATSQSGLMKIGLQLSSALLKLFAAVFSVVDSLKAIKERLGSIPGPIDILIKALQFFAKAWTFIAEKIVYLLHLLQPFIDRLGQMADRLPSINDLFSTLGAKLGEIGSAVNDLTGGFFSLNNELTQTKSAADLAREALEKLQSQNDYTKKTTAELQELRKRGDEKAEAEIRRRVEKAESAEAQEDLEKKKAKKAEETIKRADRMLDNPGRLTRDQLESMTKDPQLPEKMRDKAQKELDKRDNKAKKDGAKSAKKQHDSLLTAQIAKDIEKSAKEAGAREAARALLGGASQEEADRRELAQRKAVEQRLTKQFQESGRLPPGMSQDLVQVANLPNIEQVGGRLAPPVITINNQRIEVTGNTFQAMVSVEGTSGTPGEIAAALLNQARPVLWEDMGRAIMNHTTTLRRG